MPRITPRTATTLEQALGWRSGMTNTPALGEEPIGSRPVDVGTRIRVFSRGYWRGAAVVKVGPTTVTVAYTTPGGIEEADRRGWFTAGRRDGSPRGCTITEKTVRRTEAFYLRGHEVNPTTQAMRDEAVADELERSQS